MNMVATGTLVWIVMARKDVQRGFPGLSAQVQYTLNPDPFPGHVCLFRGQRGEGI